MHAYISMRHLGLATLITLTFVATSHITHTYAADSVPAPLNVRAGLWQITTTSGLLSLASEIPPEQMKNIGDLAKEYGFELPPIENGAAKTNTCITSEMVSQQMLPTSFQSQAGCSVKHAARNGNSYHMEYVCDNADIKGTGVADGVLTTAESFTGRTSFKGAVQGNIVNEEAEFTGQWLSASCEIKP